MKKKKLLIISYYFDPDIGPGAFRTKSIYDLLINENKDIDVEVLTTEPVRYDSFNCIADSDSNCKIHRIRIGNHNNKFIKQVLGYIKFSLLSFWFIRNKKYDVVFATSSRLLTGFLGALISRYNRAKYFLDIRDLFVENLSITVNGTAYKIVSKILRKIERFTIQSSDYVSIVSEGFQEPLKRLYPDASFFVHTNGIDEQFLNFDFTKKEYHEVKKIVYAGNIGKAQSLEKIIPQIANLKFDSVDLNRYLIDIYGDGSAIEELRHNVRGLDNVIINQPVARSELLNIYKKSDILLIHLDTASCLDLAIPSKIFEYSATGKPIIAGVRGIAKKIIDEEIDNAFSFSPCDFNECIECLDKIQYVDLERSRFREKYSRSLIAKNMVNQIERLLHG